MQEAELKTCVDVRVGLPCNLLGALRIEHRGNHSVGVLDGVCVCISEVSDIVVTLRADGCLQLEVVQPVVCAAEKVFPIENPRAAE